MQEVRFDNGVVLQWDDTLKVGELITAYASGYHILTMFEFRDGSTPLIHYVTVVKENGDRVKKPGTPKVCDASYVRRVTRQDVLDLYTTEHNAIIKKRDNLLDFVPQQE